MKSSTFDPGLNHSILFEIATSTNNKNININFDFDNCMSTSLHYSVMQ